MAQHLRSSQVKFLAERVERLAETVRGMALWLAPLSGAADKAENIAIEMRDWIDSYDSPEPVPRLCEHGEPVWTGISGCETCRDEFCRDVLP